MGVFDRKATSLEILNSAKLAVDALEQELIDLRDVVLEKKDMLHKSKKKISDLSAMEQEHLLESAQVQIHQTNLEEEIRYLKEKIAALHESVQHSKKIQHRALQKAAELRVKIVQTQDNQDSIEDIIKKETKDFTSEREKLLLLQGDLNDATQNDRKKRHYGPAEREISFGINTVSSFSTVHALGDLHGWAPGLLNYLSKHNMADVYVGGVSTSNDKAMLSLFPDPIQRHTDERALPRVGLDGNPIRCQNIQTAFHRIRVQEINDDQALILVGDVIDRGDHNEFILECVRQSILTNMGARWMLMGNHEQMVIEDDFPRWEKNEYNYMAESNKEHAGSFLHQPLLTGEPTIGEGMQTNFKIIEAGLGAVLLGQHLALLNTLEPTSLKQYTSLVDPILKKLKLQNSKIEAVMKGSKWDMQQIGTEFLSGLRGIPATNPFAVPGAIAMVLTKEHLFMHAEPNGLEGVSDEMWNDLETLQTKQGLNISLARMKEGKIIDPSYLWARGWKETKVDLHLLTRRIQSEPVRTIVHGHQSGPGIRFDEIISKDKKITVVAIDEGMTPYYFYNYGNFAEAYNPLRIPSGYTVVSS